MALLLSVGSLDISAYIRAQPDEGFEPTSGDYMTQVFAGSTALGDGKVFINEAADNRQIAASLWLKSASADLTIALLSSLKAACVKGAQVQLRPEGASNVSWFDLQAADVKPKFSHHHLVHGWLQVQLTLYVSPRASTGTNRILASAVGVAARDSVVSGVLGDVGANMNIKIAAASEIGNDGNSYVAAWAYRSQPSFVGVIPPASMTFGTASLIVAGTLTTDAKAVGSRAWQAAVSPTTAGAAALHVPAPAAAYAGGRYRMLVIARSRISVPVAAQASKALGVEIIDADGLRYGSQALISSTDYSVLDMGEVTMRSGEASAGLGAPTLSLSINCYGASGGSIIASPGFHVGGLVYLPVDEAAGLVNGAMAGPGPPIQELWLTSVPAQHAAAVGSGVLRAEVTRYHAIPSGVITNLFAGGQYRGVPPGLPPVGTQGGKLVTLIGRTTQFDANIPVTFGIEVRERFAFLR